MKKALLLLLFPLLLASCSLLDSRTNEVVICSSLPLNGGENARAQSMSWAIEMAIDQQNRQGGVVLDGKIYPLRYVPMDDTAPDSDKWDTGQEARNARAAIAEHDCIAYIGTFNSGAAKIAIPILNRVQMAMISPGNTYPGLTKPEQGLGDEPWIYSPLGPEKRNFCRVVPADDLQAPAAAKYAANTLKLKRVFIFHDTELYGKGLADIFAATAPEIQMEVVGELGINSRLLTSDNPKERQQHADEVASQIMDTRPDLVYFGGETASGPGHVLNVLRLNGYDGYFMGADAIAESAFLTDAGISTDERVYATLVALPPSQLGETGAQWANNYRQRYGKPDAFAAPSYEATLVVIDAIERANLSPYQGDTLLERARPAVLQAMKDTKEFNGILGPWSFDKNCDTNDTTITMNQAIDGAFQFKDIVPVNQ